MVAPHIRIYTWNCKENLQLSLETNEMFWDTDKTGRYRRSDDIVEAGTPENGGIQKEAIVKWAAMGAEVPFHNSIIGSFMVY